MASIFSYDPDPPRVSSPWPTGTLSGRLAPAERARRRESSRYGSSAGDDLDIEIEQLDIKSLTRLEAEPQEGPTEYKLHLLLRPRKSVSSGNNNAKTPSAMHPLHTTASPSRSYSSSPLAIASVAATSNVSRQHRLEQLTTQLLWRLQQSSPYHATSATSVVLPSLPPATPELRPPEQLAKLTPGLEESKGALYEIGVSDDGTLVGLTSDEMNESLNNLRAMAASLGCSVEVQRMVCVGECQSKLDGLYVAEAFVKPELQSVGADRGRASNMRDSPFEEAVVDSAASTIEQLRVSLTGATTCGKSSLLGTLSTSTLDNARGKSRLSLLKHRHEIVSGVTSSVAQELVGYQDVSATSEHHVKVVNYADENVSTWNDIHASADLSRLALLSDSAGHPRFRRTTVRGLVGWDPHWTFLCIAANEDHSHSTRSEDSKLEDDGSFPGANAHISMAHLDLCLRLQVPLVIVVTKYDMATKTSLRQLLLSLLTHLKDAGRRPVVVTNQKTTSLDLNSIPSYEQDDVQKLIKDFPAEFNTAVMIVLTSAVSGEGISKLHALLRYLPIPVRNGVGDESIACLFNIDDSFKVPSLISSTGTKASAAGSVVSGYISHGSVSVGDVLSLGPFPSTSHQDRMSSSSPSAHLSTSTPASGSYETFLSPRSFSDALARTTSSPRLRPSDPSTEWRRVSVISIRNLRLPVRTLYTDQVGTIGIAPFRDPASSTIPLSLPPMRKGLVLGRGKRMRASHSFTARFAVQEAANVVVGSVVVAYCATVRAGARVVAVALEGESRDGDGDVDGSGSEAGIRNTGNRHAEGAAGSVDEGTGFRFDEDGRTSEHEQEDTREEGDAAILVTFQFVAVQEWLEVGARLLVMPSGGSGGDRRGVRGLVGGLEGFVGCIVETFE